MFVLLCCRSKKECYRYPTLLKTSNPVFVIRDLIQTVPAGQHWSG